MTVAVVSLLVGLGFGTGTWLIGQTMWRPQRWAATRIAPYLSDLSADAHDVAMLSTGTQRNVVVERIHSLRKKGEAERVQAQIRRAGLAIDANEWLLHRFLFAAGGSLAGLIVGGLYGLSVASASPVVGLCLLGGVAGWALPLWALHRRVRQRARSLQDEMTAGLDLLSLCVSAGEDLVSALTRVSSLGSGPFSNVIRDALAQIELGIPVATALDSSARSADVPALTRFIEHLTATLERGTPVVDVLLAQVADLREESKHKLIESSGRNEVVMLVPLVFLILPVTIAFAVYPGLIAIQSGL